MDSDESQIIFLLVDNMVKNDSSARVSNKEVFDVERGIYVYDHSPLLPLEGRVEVWTKEHPEVWNVGIGTTASFVPTLTRLILESIKDLYGPHDHMIQVKVPPTAAASTINHLVVLEVFMAIASGLNITSLGPELQELKQLAADESYYGYGMVSEDLMLRAWGRDYFYVYKKGIEELDYKFHRQPNFSPIRKRILEAFSQRKRYLLVLEDLHAPVSLDVLSFIVEKRPSLVHSQWLISSTSNQFCDQSKSRQTVGAFGTSFVSYEAYHVEDGHYHAVPRGDLDKQDWSELINGALQDVAGSILRRLQQDQGIHHHPFQGDHKFWLHLAHHCLYYGILYHPLGGAVESYPVSPEELVRCWVAEDLIFPGTSIPSAMAKKQSKYRSAYEASKVVIQALQEYSLLPRSHSVPNRSSASRTAATASASSQDVVVTGVSMLGKGVPRLKQDELFVPHNKKWVSFMEGDGRHVSLDWRERSEFIPGEKIMTTLILRCYADISGFPFEQVLNSHLRVLDLSYTMMESLPSSISRLWNLRLLSLRGCSQLKTLSQQSPPTPEQQNPQPLSHLGNLEVLDLNGAPLLELTQQDGSNKSNLHYLDLSGSKVTTLPPEFFRKMSSLEELILGNCSNLKELPPSVAELSTLLILHVEGTRIMSFAEGMFEAMQRLHTLKLINNMLLISLPGSLSKAKGLKELHIYNCIGLRLDFLWELVPCLEDLYIQTWEALEDIKIQGHPNLRMFSLSGPGIRYLSLRWCRRLKTVNFGDDLTDLEDVDLSGTDLEEIPHNLPNLSNLRKLLLLNVPCFKRFPWHKLVRFPKVFYLDNCSSDDNQFPEMFCQQEINADENQHAEKTTNTAQININDSRIFHSFNTDAANKLVNEGQFLQSFGVQVKSCSVKGNKTHDIEGEVCMQRQTPYLDVHCSEAENIMPMMMLHSGRRHVEISAKNRYPHALKYLLSVASSIFIIDDVFVRCLTDLSGGLMCLEECHLQSCQQMAVVFIMKSNTLEYTLEEYATGHKVPRTLSFLRILQISNSNNLLSLVEPSDLKHSYLITLRLLKHIHLEYCPRLVKLFPCSLSLPALETLVILFCSNLKTIFYTEPQYQIAPSPLPKIERIYFQELPQLLHTNDNVNFLFEMPKWEKLFVRGCRSFQHLPLLKKEYPKSKVEVSGERDWWGRLQRLPEQSENYLHVPPPEFASRKKHIIRSYLR